LIASDISCNFSSASLDACIFGSLGISGPPVINFGSK